MPKKVKATKASATPKKKFALPGAGVLLGVSKMKKGIGAGGKTKLGAIPSSTTATLTTSGVTATSGTESDESNTSLTSTVTLLKVKSKLGKSAKTLNVQKSQASPKSSSLTLIQNIPLPTQTELEFMGYVAAGYFNDASSFLEKFGQADDFDINKTNSSGYTALHMAVDRQDEEMIKLLLACPGITIFDTFFYAVKEGSRDIVKLFIDFELDNDLKGVLSQKNLTQEEIEERRKMQLLNVLERFRVAKNETINSEFSADLTALMLAAQCGHYELIKYFFDAGQRLNEVADLDVYKTEGDLLITYNRLHLFQAVSNPVYISFFALEFYAVDPILQAFNLITQLKYFAQMESEVGEEYIELAKTLEEYCAELLALCRDDEEVKILLQQRGGYQSSGTSEESYPRLMVAIEKNQQAFVTHANTQTKLYEEWIKGYEEWRCYTAFQKTWAVFYRILFCPIISAILCLYSDCCAKESIFVASWKAPISRFILNSGMYAWFLILLLLEVFSEDWFGDNFDIQTRQAPSGSNARVIIDATIGLFCLGHFVGCLKRFGFMPARYFQSQWNIFELVTNLFFLVAFTAWIYAWILNPLKTGIPRTKWSHYDPLLIGEGCFAIGLVMSYLRLFRILMIHPKLGPLLRAFGHMQKEIEKVLVLFVVLLISFGLGMCMLYKGYDEFVDEDPETGDEESQPGGFTTFWGSMETLFYGFFGGSDLENTQIVTIHVPHHHNHSQTVAHHHTLTETTGKIIFALFVICGNIILVNTTVTLMTNSTEKVFEDVDASWKFARAEVWTYYGRRSMIVPPPFNIISIFRTTIICKCLGIGTKGKKYHAGCSFTRCFYLDEVNPESDRRLRTDYSILIKDLTQRYFRKKATISSGDTATMDQVNKLREYVAQMKERCKVK